MVDIKRITDLKELLKWRMEVIEHVFGITPDQELLHANRAYYQNHIPDNSHIAFVAYFNGEKAGTGSICLTDELPSPDNPSGHCAYLMNIYVRDRFREHGIGHIIVKELIKTAWNLDCKKIYLETTEEGRGLYKSIGFKDYPDIMKFNLDKIPEIYP